MKRQIILFIVLFTGCFSFSQSEETTISNFYFIRHAEKDRSDENNKNPHLTEKGVLRAEKWSEVLKNISFDAVYSTNYYRTRETAQPTALKNNLDITLYNPNSVEIEAFLKSHEGKNILIVGHSNTTPKFVNAILGHNQYQEIEDSNNANLYIVTIDKENKSGTLLFIE